MKKVICLAGVILTVVCSGRADVLAAWDVVGIELDAGAGIESASAPYRFNATTVADLVTAQMTLGAGVNPSTSKGQYGFKVSATDEQTSLSGAIQQNHYIQFSLGVDAGYTLNLQSLEMVGKSSDAGCSNVVLMTSIDGFKEGQEIASAFPANKTGGFDTDSSGFGDPIDLTPDKYQELTGIIDFRLYGWNSTDSDGITYIRTLADDDLIISGAIKAIPEPAAISFIALASLSLITARRWFR